MLIAIFESLIYEGGTSSGTGDIGVIRNTVIGLKLRTQPILISLFFWEKTASSGWLHHGAVWREGVGDD